MTLFEEVPVSVSTEVPRRRVELTLNGERKAADIEPRLLLAHLIRNGFKLTGTHTGCDTTNCGACTVLLDGEPVKSCTVLAVQADGHEVIGRGRRRVGVGDRLMVHAHCRRLPRLKPRHHVLERVVGGAVGGQMLAAVARPPPASTEEEGDEDAEERAGYE